MRKTLLIGAAVFVAGALLVLVIWSRSSSMAAPKVAKSTVESKDDKRARSGAPLTRVPRPKLSDRQRKREPKPRAERRDRQVREYVNEHGALVRDHRSGDAPEYNFDTLKSPRQKKIEPRVANGVRDAVYEAVRGCRDSIPQEAFGDKSKAQAEILVNVDEGQVSAQKALVKLGGLEEQAGQELATCIQEQAAQMSFPAEGHKKVSEYRVTLIFPLH